MTPLGAIVIMLFGTVIGIAIGWHLHGMWTERDPPGE
jgi:hypothetical protein